MPRMFNADTFPRSSADSQSAGGDVAPVANLTEATLGYVLSRCLHVVAELGVADALKEAPATAAELALAVSAQPDALGRLLRLLAGYGIFGIADEGFTHTPASRLLRTDDPRSMRAFVRLMGLPLYWSAYEHLVESARSGRPAAETVHRGGVWGYLGEHPEAAAIFNTAMADKARAEVAGVLAAYDFTGFDTIGDIGGGRGHLLRAALDMAPATRGVLFDLPRVIQEAPWARSEHLILQAGDFFTDALPVCDLYLLMDVLIDWPDAEALAILRAVRRAAPAHAKLLVIEQLAADDRAPHAAWALDVHMLALVGGRQRTQQQYGALLAQSGFAMARATRTRTAATILEAVALSGERPGL